MEKALGRAYELKTQQLGMHERCKTEGKVLNRVLRCTPAVWEMILGPEVTPGTPKVAR